MAFRDITCDLALRVLSYLPPLQLTKVNSAIIRTISLSRNRNATILATISFATNRPERTERDTLEDGVKAALGTWFGFEATRWTSGRGGEQVQLAVESAVSR